MGRRALSNDAVDLMHSVATAAGATRWEYKCVLTSGLGGLKREGNALGQAGWEMAVGASNGAICFKRPLH